MNNIVTNLIAFVAGLLIGRIIRELLDVRRT